jgi:hypothetical protein
VLRRGPPGLPRGARGAGRPGAGNRAGVKAEALARERSDRVGEGPGGARSLDAERSPVTDHRWRLTGRSPGGLPASNPSAARGAGSAATEAPGEPEGRDQEVSRRRADMPHLRRGELAPLVPKPPCLQTLTFRLAESRTFRVARSRPPGAGGAGPLMLLAGSPCCVQCMAGWPPCACCRKSCRLGLMVSLLPSHAAPWSWLCTWNSCALLRGARPMGTKDCSGSNPGASRSSHAQSRPAVVAIPAMS